MALKDRREVAGGRGARSTRSKAAPGPKPSSAAKGVYVSLSAEALERLDKLRASLGLPRGAALRAIFERFGDEGAEAERQDLAKVEAEVTAKAVTFAPLVDAMTELTKAYVARAHALDKIGVHSNQMAKLANGGGHVDPLALAGVERAIDELRAGMASDASLLAELRIELDRARA